MTNSETVVPPVPWKGVAGVVVLATLYGTVRGYWALGNAPRFAPLPQDLMIFTGWGSVGLCALCAAAALAMWLAPGSKWVLFPAWGAVAAVLVACPALLLDVVGNVLPGLGIPLNAVSSLSRSACFGMGAGLALLAIGHHRRSRGVCVRCGRDPSCPDPARLPRWAWWAAYIAVSGCVARILSQYLIGFTTVMPLRVGAALVVFEIGFLLAGILLPLALVHRFGHVWPRWVPRLSGRRVPRWLVLGPGFFVGIGMSVYFGFSMVRQVADTVSSRSPYDSGAESAFMFTAIAAYLLWGLGITAASFARLRVGRPECRRCGTGGHLSAI